MVHKGKMMSSSAFFIFSKFWFFWLLGGSTSKKWPKMTKDCLLCLIFQESYTIWSSFMVHICKRIIFPFFFTFFPNFNFRPQQTSGVKWQKMAQNDKKLCLLYFISQIAYIIWLWFLIHIYKMMTSPNAFSMF